MIGKIIMIIGILGVLLGGAVLLISLLLPVVTDGRTSWDEALLGIIPGAIVLVISFVIFAGGLIIVLVQRKKKQQVRLAACLLHADRQRVVVQTNQRAEVWTNTVS